MSLRHRARTAKLRSPRRANSLRASCRRSKRPRQYALAAELPRTATGKIQRHKLRADLQIAR
jgi:acyl-coenzyme A synthetase/AMP-(fatty) acid ligase